MRQGYGSAKWGLSVGGVSQDGTTAGVGSRAAFGFCILNGRALVGIEEGPMERGGEKVQQRGINREPESLELWGNRRFKRLLCQKSQFMIVGQKHSFIFY